MITFLIILAVAIVSAGVSAILIGTIFTSKVLTVKILSVLGAIVSVILFAGTTAFLMFFYPFVLLSYISK